jgi:small ligand-binding sensory domain FIST
MTIDEVLGPIATAGLVTAGEFAPLGGRSYVLDGAASIALLRDAWVGSRA